jgi:SAM-dependent methyltransferase
MSEASASWEWDETLYAGAARYYAAGRMPYPADIADCLREELGLDGTGNLLDVGCASGQLTLLLAPLFRSVTGIDASTGMIAAARARAGRAGMTGIRWLRMRAEDISPGLGLFRAVTFAQSFHWLNRPVVGRAIRDVLEPGGSCVLVYATTHQGVASEDPLPLPRPPWAAINRLIGSYLGTTRKAGRGVRPARERPGDNAAMSDEAVLLGAGYTGPTRIAIAAGPVVERGEDEIVASVFSLSYAAPSLFGANKPGFEQDLRAMLRSASPHGRFCEQPRDIRVEIWRPAHE